MYIKSMIVANVLRVGKYLLVGVFICVLFYYLCRNSILEDVNLSEDVFDEQIRTSVVHNILTRYLIPPSDKPYKLLGSSDFNPSMGQAQIVVKLFKNKKGGFFVESGALDGETRSNTLYFEIELGWRGLLIEPDPDNFQLMILKNRKAWLSNTCLSIHPYPELVFFMKNFNQGKIVMPSQSRITDPNIIKVQCFPLYSLLIAINVTVVDYFSLDVEGSEYEILKTIPFHRLDIKVLSVEFVHNHVKPSVIEKFMLQKGYIVYTTITRDDFLANDFIFVKKSYLKSITDSVSEKMP